MKNENLIYLNTAACGLISPAIRQAGARLYNEFEWNSSSISEHWRESEYFAIKKNVASFLQADEKSIAFIPNFSSALNAIVHSLKGTEKILLYRKDYPSVHIPFIINNFDVSWIEEDNDFFINTDEIASVIQKKEIDIVVISHVQWQSGYKIDLALLGTICKEHGALLIADTTQSLGASVINLADLQVDVLIASNYKWMNAGFGTGLLYMSQAFLEQYPPKISGNASRTFFLQNGNYVYTAAVTDYEPGSLDMFGFTIMNKSIEEKKEIGLGKIEAHNLQLTQQLLDGLAILPVKLKGNYSMQNRSSIICLKEEPGLHAFLLKNDIITTSRNGLIRISMHYHNTEHDIQKILVCMNSYYRRD